MAKKIRPVNWGCEEMPIWVLKKILEFPAGQEIRLTGTVRARLVYLNDNPHVSLWATTGRIVGPVDLI